MIAPPPPRRTSATCRAGCARAFEAFEPAARFAARPWNKPAGHRLQGGGESRLMRGEVFEKVGVNVSHVWGVLAPEARGQVAGAEASDGRFVASGISLVAHMANPYVPAMHMNLRYLSTSRAWFGGGADLTPTFPFEEDTAAFHGALRAACEGYRPDSYAEFKAWCDRYFYLPHRQEPRGVGGIFFDDLAGKDQDADFGFVRAVGEALLQVYPRIVARRKDTPFDADAREQAALQARPLRGVQPGVRPRYPLRLQYRCGSRGVPDEPAAGGEVVTGTATGAGRGSARSQRAGEGQNSRAGRIFAAARQCSDRIDEMASSASAGGRHRPRSLL